MKRRTVVLLVLACIFMLLLGCENNNKQPQSNIRVVEVKASFPEELIGVYDGKDSSGETGTVIISSNDFSVMGVSMINLVNSTIRSNEVYARENGLSYEVSYEATSPVHGEYSLSVRQNVEGLIHFAVYYFKLNKDGTVTLSMDVLDYDGTATSEEIILTSR